MSLPQQRNRVMVRAGARAQPRSVSLQGRFGLSLPENSSLPLDHRLKHDDGEKHVGQNGNNTKDETNRLTH